MLTTIDQIRHRLIEAYDPERIILFGSRARGEATEKSDVDLLVLKETSDRPIDRRIQVEKILADRALPLDILVYTPDELRYLFSIGSPFIEEIMESGRVLYMRKASESWLKDAADDLSSALILFEHGAYKAACYHSQQSVEKGLRALILEKGDRTDKVHDIVELAARARGQGWGIDLSLDDAVYLNSIYKGRYPTEEGLLPQGMPSQADGKRAVAAAQALMGSVRSGLGALV